jgi:hypothetical protein
MRIKSKGCPRCHGDLAYDPHQSNNTLMVWACIQCGKEYSWPRMPSVQPASIRS